MCVCVHMYECNVSSEAITQLMSYTCVHVWEMGMRLSTHVQ